jgi:CheY-like chemotaxis protein
LRLEAGQEGVQTAKEEITILLVEDSKLLRLAGERALHRAGYQVLAAADGEQALRMARENHPHVILLDMLLPKVSGLDVLRALKSDAQTKDIPVIVLSSLAKANEDKLLAEGAAAFFEKSEQMLQDDYSELLRKVGRVLAKPRG